ncbi:MAG: endolytic transglycosylase MltG [Thermodesulfobacteriota bacterium]|nr:endolytic transglycosylase MltG [Thermodesulfobacteriota bacterium]
MKASIILVVAAVFCVVALWMGLSFYRYATTPQQSSGATVAVWIRPGESFAETVVQLQRVGIVRHPKRFRWLAYLKGDERRIRAGEYLLRSPMAPTAILETLVRGKALLHKVVVPEGSTIFRIGQILETAGLVSQETFLEKASDPSFTKALGVEGDTFEGYLFPETYRFAKGVSAEKIIRTMVSHFRSIFTPAWAERAREMGLSTQEVITLASIVEKETAKSEERPLIAAVFLNRLRLGMGLESDPTVIYGIKGFDGNLTRKDLETFTPYNTYRIAGLPAGPISNPGQASMEAVLYSSKQPYLYFVSKNDGSHHFSSTLAEHNIMVDRYQRRRSSRH